MNDNDFPKTWKQWQKLAWDIVKNGGYFPIAHRYKGLPVITGCPKIIIEKYRVHVGRSKFSRGKMSIGVLKAPREPQFHKIINFNFRKHGAPQICLKGNMGTYKSNVLNLIACFFAAKGLRMIGISDDAFEFRNIAAHGWYDNNENFYPFQIDVWIPKDYKLKEKSTTNPLWNYRDNVKRCDYTTIDDILDSLEPHKFTIIYESCFTKASKLKLLNDIYMYCAENVALDKNYMILHHELQSLIRENPTTDIYDITQEIKDRFARSRKDKVGILTSYHTDAEVYHSISRKFRFIGEKKPANKRTLSKVEKDMQKQRRDSFNMAIDGYWATHTVGYFPELPDIYRIVPQRKKLLYPELIFEGETNDQNISIDPVTLRIISLRLAGKTYDEISNVVGMPKGTIYSRIQKYRDG